MASAHPGLRRIGLFWHYELRVNGQRLHGSTKAMDLATAKKVLETKRREALEGQYRIVSRIPTLQDIFYLWQKNHQGVFSPKHLVPVGCIYRKWLQPRLGATKIDQIGSSAVDSLRSEALRSGRSPRYVNNMLKILKLLLNYGVKTGFIKEAPVQIKMLRLQKKPRPVLPAARVSEFFAAMDEAADNPHVPVMIRVMVGLGLREGEVLGMRREWFDLINRNYIVGKSKGKEGRVIPVPSWLWDAIHNMPQSHLSDWVPSALFLVAFEPWARSHLVNSTSSASTAVIRGVSPRSLVASKSTPAAMSRSAIFNRSSRRAMASFQPSGGESDLPELRHHVPNGWELLLAQLEPDEGEARNYLIHRHGLLRHAGSRELIPEVDASPGTDHHQLKAFIRQLTQGE